MKNFLFVLSLLLGMVLSSCSKGDDAPQYSEKDVIGTWTITKCRNTSLGMGEWESISGATITFTANGEVVSNYKYFDNIKYYSVNGGYLEGLGFWIDLQYHKDGMKWPSTFEFIDGKKTVEFGFNSCEYILVK